ncbi:hypothetical protein [Natronoarchaeum rubrum]|uniref:hypothetical protein n=1 Tax=Natronoarchaeum rubrum TaxID=755311 RepID=UPI002112BC1D|nr:hypothetical protein [Natronoarchaeum rubrum]
MRANSLLQGVRRVDQQGAALLSLRTFSGAGPTWRIDVAMSALVDIAELLRAAAPFPPHQRSATAIDDYRSDGGEVVDEAAVRRDDLVPAVLDASYERGGATVESLEPDVAEQVEASRRLRTVDSWIFVPLSPSGPYARNWKPVLETLLARLDDVLDDFRRIVGRVRADDSDAALTSGCDAIVEMVETLVRILRQADAGTRYVRERTDHRQGELLSAIERTTTQLRSDDNA